MKSTNFNLLVELKETSRDHQSQWHLGNIKVCEKKIHGNPSNNCSVWTTVVTKQPLLPSLEPLAASVAKNVKVVHYKKEGDESLLQ